MTILQLVTITIQHPHHNNSNNKRTVGMVWIYLSMNVYLIVVQWLWRNCILFIIHHVINHGPVRNKNEFVLYANKFIVFGLICDIVWNYRGMKHHPCRILVSIIIKRWDIAQPTNRQDTSRCYYHHPANNHR